ncbi:MAG: DUF3298 domain-containing protein [Prevotella sp.]|nr:DUF3298 domain-containing protein [Prevotella sp.]
MKKVFLFMALAAASVNSCDELMSSATESGKSGSDVSATDSIQIATTLREVEDSSGMYSISLQLPVDQKSALAKAVNEYATEMMGGTFEGEYTDTTAMADHYLKGIIDEYHEMYGEVPHFAVDGMKLLDNIKMFKVYETPKVVTYEYTTETFTGGAHGGFYSVGQTFRRSDGRRIGWDILQHQYGVEFQEMLKHGLKEYFDIGSDDELKGMLLSEDKFYTIPLPQCPPLFVKDGVMFVYNQYEIAPYAAGLPTFVIAYDKIRQYLNVTGKRLLE